MRPLVISACCLFLLPLGCQSVDGDPAAAAKAAHSAAGALEHAKTQPSEVGGSTIDDDDGHPGVPNGPTDVKPPPSVGTATCIVTDGDDGDGHDGDGDGQKKPPKKPGTGTIITLDPAAPELQEAVPKSAASGGPKAKAKAGGPAPAPGKRKSSKAVAKSAAGAPMTTSKTAQRVDWGAHCSSQMDEDACQSLCGDRNLTWNRTAGSGGTCFETSLVAAADGSGSGSLRVVKCGCMCGPRLISRSSVWSAPRRIIDRRWARPCPAPRSIAT